MGPWTKINILLTNICRLLAGYWTLESGSWVLGRRTQAPGVCVACVVGLRSHTTYHITHASRDASADMCHHDDGISELRDWDWYKLYINTSNTDIHNTHLFGCDCILLGLYAFHSSIGTDRECLHVLQIANYCMHLFILSFTHAWMYALAEPQGFLGVTMPLKTSIWRAKPASQPVCGL